MADFSRLMLPFEDGSLSIPQSGTIVALRAQPDAYKAFPDDRLICEQSFYPLSDILKKQGYTVGDSKPESAEMVVLHITRSKEETRALISKAYETLVLDGLLLVDGAKTDGIDSLLKTVKKIVAVDGQLSKAHGKVFWLRKQNRDNPFLDWGSALTPTKNKDGWLTAAGMFSADGIDPGSIELTRFIDGNLKGKGADLGAGWGWLAAKALEMNPEITSLDLVEAEKTALDCARNNITDERATFHWADATSFEAKKTYDFVIMNPPFHIGRKADPSLGRSFIAAAASMLKSTGHLYVVANRQLAYETTLDERFSRWEVLQQTSRYKVIHARKPK